MRTRRLAQCKSYDKYESVRNLHENIRFFAGPVKVITNKHIKLYLRKVYDAHV